MTGLVSRSKSKGVNGSSYIDMCTSAVENDAAAEERRQAEIGAGRSKDPSAQIKKTSDQMLR